MVQPFWSKLFLICRLCPSIVGGMAERESIVWHALNRDAHQLQYNTIQVYCPRGEIRLPANKNTRNIKTSQHCILYIVTTNCKRSQSISTNTQTHTRTHIHHTHKLTHTHTHTHARAREVSRSNRRIDAEIKRMPPPISPTNWNSKTLLWWFD